jgi:hypothetical protein
VEGLLYCWLLRVKSACTGELNHVWRNLHAYGGREPISLIGDVIR